MNPRRVPPAVSPPPRGVLGGVRRGTPGCGRVQTTKSQLKTNRELLGRPGQVVSPPPWPSHATPSCWGLFLSSFRAWERGCHSTPSLCGGPTQRASRSQLRNVRSVSALAQTTVPTSECRGQSQVSLLFPRGTHPQQARKQTPPGGVGGSWRPVCPPPPPKLSAWAVWAHRRCPSACPWTNTPPGPPGGDRALPAPRWPAEDILRASCSAISQPSPTGLHGQDGD